MKANIEAVVVCLYLFMCTYYPRYFNNLKICYIRYRLFSVGNYLHTTVTFCSQSSHIQRLKMVMCQCFWFQCWLSQWYSLSKNSFSLLGKSNKIIGIMSLLCSFSITDLKNIKKNPNLSSFRILNHCLTWLFKTIFGYQDTVCDMSESAWRKDAFASVLLSWSTNF